MYRLLIVDNEPNIVKGLYELMAAVTEPELDICCAYSASEALVWLERTKIDIVLTDIRMPGMSGLELHRQIRKIWPRCQVIYLTGYDDFEYAQTAIKLGGVDYLLKTDDDEAVVEAVKRAVGRSAEELAQASLIEGAKRQARESAPILRRHHLLQLLNGEARIDAKTLALLRDYGMSLDPEAPVLLVVGRVDKWDGDPGPHDKPLLGYAVQNIAEECLACCRIESVPLDAGSFAWLVQPAAVAEGEDGYRPQKTETYVHGMLDSIQSACRKLLKLRMSFIAAGEACAWALLSDRFRSLRSRLSRGLGLEGGLLMIERQERAEGGAGEAAVQAASERSAEAGRKLAACRRLLGDSLDAGRREPFLQGLEELLALARPAAEGEPADQGLLYEIYYAAAGTLLPAVNQCRQELGEEFAPYRLMSLEAHGGWEEAADYLRRLADRLFATRQDDHEEETHAIVRRINDYIRNNLEGDLSLTRLGEVAYLHPTYLCRLYKQVSGVGVSDRIHEERMRRACELLADPALRIHEIAGRIGYISSSYFTRIFKKTMLQTPQEYRESLARKEGGTARAAKSQ